MKTIEIAINNKIASVAEAGTFIVGWNNDYQIHFTFDDPAWTETEIKTARFIFGTQIVDKVFTGDTCPGVRIEAAYGVAVGVYAGNISTSTPAFIDVKKSIVDDEGLPLPPDPDVYLQLLQLMSTVTNAEATVDDSVGTPSVEVSFTTDGEGHLQFDFHNLKGARGDQGVGISSVVLNADYTLTFNFSDGTSTTTGSVRGQQGEIGVGISSTVLNDDYTLTINFDNGTSYTTPSIRGLPGAQGARGHAYAYWDRPTLIAYLSSLEDNETAYFVNIGPSDIQITSHTIHYGDVWKAETGEHGGTWREYTYTYTNTIIGEPGTASVTSVNGKTGTVVLDISDLGLTAVFNLKGSKPTASALPSSGNNNGDVWYVVDESVGYIWLNDGTTDRWEPLGISIDLSGYVTTQMLNTALEGYIQKDGNKGLSDFNFSATYKQKLDNVKIPIPETHSILSSAWSALTDSDPFDYSATITLIPTLGANSTVELINDNAILFANHGFSILSVSGQTATIASIGQPDDSVTLKVVVTNG